MTRLRATLACGLGAGAVTVAFTAPFLRRYGWERDELYFLAASKRPALGYVDFPPLTAWVGWVVRSLAGSSLLGFRLTTLACGVLSVVLTALIARELGGGLGSQLGAALAWAATPFVLASGTIFHTTWFDLLARVAFLYVAVRVLGRPEPRLWPLLGLLAGLGLQTKYTIVALLGVFVAALVVTGRRSVLRTPGPWIAAGVALLVFLPNLVWQARHDWPSVRFFGSQHQFTSAQTSHADFVVQQPLFLGAASVLALLGVVHLWRRPELRPLALVPVGVTLLFLVERGQGTYALPVDALPVAAGAVALGRWTADRRVLVGALAVLVAIQAAAYAVVLDRVVPLRSTASMVRSGTWRGTGWRPSVFQEEIGWPELAAQTERVWRSLPPADRRRGVVLASNYGEAGALELDWPRAGRPPIVSGHLSWQYWRPATLEQRVALVVGYDAPLLDRLCGSWRTRAVIENRWRLPNVERGKPVAECRLRAPLERLWRPLIVRNGL